MKKELIRLVNCDMEFDGEAVLKSINLTVYDKEFLTLLGPSGCGKTTTLRIIGGFETPTSGEVLFDGVRFNDVPPYKRKVNTIFQRYALFPHLDVFENVAFGLRVNKTPKNQIEPKVAEMLQLVGLKGYEYRDVSSLSGGQQQRVAIARALVNSPQVLLLDEPLGALDLKLRKEMQAELKRIQQQSGITFIYVTHDQEEALSMSDTIAVMNNGIIQQMGTPTDIYNEPENAFVADFIGESNIIDGIMKRDYFVSFGGKDYVCVDAGFNPNEEVEVVVRPEDIDVVSPEDGLWSGVVKSIAFKGVHYEIVVDSGDYVWTIHSTDAQVPGTIVGMMLSPEDLHIMHKFYSDGSISEAVEVE